MEAATEDKGGKGKKGLMEISMLLHAELVKKKDCLLLRHEESLHHCHGSLILAVL